MAASGVGVAPIAIVGAAFGLATSTFTNLSSRLVLEVNQSTVQSVVLTSQNKYRFTLINGDPLTVPPTPPTVIVSRPSAIYVLRSYLRLCLPFTIETQINTTVTAVDRGDTEATYRKPLITPAAAGVPFTARSVIVRPSREAPPAATSPLIKYIEGGSSTQGDATYIKNVLRKLCVPPGQLDSYNAYTIARIIAYQQYMTGNVDPTKPPAGRLSPHDLTTLSSEPQYCKTDLFQNYFEEKEYPETQYPGGIVNEDVVGLLNKALEADQKLRTDGTATQKEVRQKIAVVRRKLGTKVLQNDQLSEQWTIDLRLVLFALR
jgi:hypothetical protein